MRHQSYAEPLNVMDHQEQIQRLVERGYGEVIDAMLMNSDRIYTKKGRLNRSALSRVLGRKFTDLDRVMRELRNILETDEGGGTSRT